LARSILKKIGGIFKKLTGKKVRPVISPTVTHQPRPEQARSQSQRTRPAGAPSRTDRGQRPERSTSGQRPERPHRQDRPRRRTGQDHALETDRRKPHPRAPRAHPETSKDERVHAAVWNPAEFTIPPEPGKVRFHDLDLPAELMHAIYDLGFRYCTPIQAGILQQTLAGADATGRAQTGTGKTAAFLITILSHLIRHPAAASQKVGTPRALIIAPTRELVLQIEKDAKLLSKHLQFKVMAVFGGMDYTKQMRLLREERIDIVVATPGRLLDFKRKGSIDLSKVEIMVIDEADRMLDMGFIPDVRRIIEATPMKGKRQTMFFSATLTPEVNRLAAAWTRNAVEIDVTPPQDVTLASIDQVVYITTDEEKFTLLFNMITRLKLERIMVFANRRDETMLLKDRLTAYGIRCGLLSGEVSQDQRVKTLEGFRGGKFEVLAATDVAARGLHIEGVSHVVNYSLPLDAQDYVHRIGRTGRAGASGTSVSFATETEAYQIPEIEKFIGRALPAVHPSSDLLSPLPPLPEGTVEPSKKRSHSSRRGGHHRRGGDNRSRRPRTGGHSSA
jgi:ATP-dependent RNA helicase RhlB